MKKLFWLVALFMLGISSCGNGSHVPGDGDNLDPLPTGLNVSGGDPDPEWDHIHYSGDLIIRFVDSDGEFVFFPEESLGDLKVLSYSGMENLASTPKVTLYPDVATSVFSFNIGTEPILTPQQISVTFSSPYLFGTSEPQVVKLSFKSETKDLLSIDNAWFGEIQIDVKKTRERLEKEEGIYYPACMEIPLQLQP